MSTPSPIELYALPMQIVETAICCAQAGKWIPSAAWGRIVNLGPLRYPLALATVVGISCLGEWGSKLNRGIGEQGDRMGSGVHGACPSKFDLTTESFCFVWC